MTQESEIYINCGYCDGRIRVPEDVTSTEILTCKEDLTEYEVMNDKDFRLFQLRLREDPSLSDLLILGPFYVKDVRYRAVEASDEDYGQ